MSGLEIEKSRCLLLLSMTSEGDRALLCLAPPFRESYRVWKRPLLRCHPEECNDEEVLFLLAFFARLLQRPAQRGAHGGRVELLQGERRRVAHVLFGDADSSFAGLCGR